MERYLAGARDPRDLGLPVPGTPEIQAVLDFFKGAHSLSNLEWGIHSVCIVGIYYFYYYYCF